MRDNYDFTNGRKNPYAKKLGKKQITINLSVAVIEYFQQLSEESDIPYQTLINIYLLDCVKNKRKVKFK